jgi:hypothetical protein
LIESRPKPTIANPSFFPGGSGTGSCCPDEAIDEIGSTAPATLAIANVLPAFCRKLRRVRSSFLSNMVFLLKKSLAMLVLPPQPVNISNRLLYTSHVFPRGESF